MKPTYIVYATYSLHKGRKYAVIHQDASDMPAVKIGYYPTRSAAMTSARLLAGRGGRVAFTYDVTTYPF